MINGELPDGWTWTTVGEIGKVKGGKRLPQGHTYSEEPTNYPYIRVVDFTKLAVNTENLKYLKEETQQLIKQYIISKEDVFISIAGSIGKVGVIPEYLDGANLTENAAKITELNKVQNKYLAYVLSSQYCQEQIASLTISTNQPKLALFRIEKIRFPLPPLPEQERIVNRIEELFSDLEAGAAGLKRVHAGLRRYKASVLKAACDGKLANGKSGIGEGELPDGWTWSTVEELNPPNRKCAYGVLQPGVDKTDGVPFVRVGDINDGRIDIQNMKRIDPEIAARYPRTKLHGGEVLITLVGAIGRTAVVPERLAGANTARAVGVIPIKDGVHAPWVEIWFRNTGKVIEMTSKAHEVARKTLNLEDVRSAKVALPPLDEQRRIVAEVERRLSVVGEVESAVEVGLVRAGRLRQSVLRSAFDGRL